MEATDDGREETDEENEVSRATPASDVALTWALTGLELGGAGVGLEGSPARSASVLRFLSLLGGGSMVERALVAAADISKSLPGVGIWLGGRSCEANCNVSFLFSIVDLLELTEFSLLYSILEELRETNGVESRSQTSAS